MIHQWPRGLVRWPGGMEAYSVSIVQESSDFAVPGGAARLADRRVECAALDRLVEAVNAGQSGALVVHGEPGAGKTTPDAEYIAGRR